MDSVKLLCLDALFLFCLSGFVSACGSTNCAVFPDAKDAAKRAANESLTPVHAGGEDGRPFWNSSAKAFIYAPAFDFKKIGRAKQYIFEITAADNSQRRFTADSPQAPLSQVWGTLPKGKTDLKVSAVDAEGKFLGVCGTRQFYKSAPFSGTGIEPKSPFSESARKALAYIFESPMGQCWLKNGKPNLPPEEHSTEGYRLYSYPSKMCSSIIDGMLAYAKLEPVRASEAIEIAKRAADYAISISEPAGAPLEFFPPTYIGNVHKKSRMFAGQIMTIYPVSMANSYLNLYEKTGDNKYYLAALRIAKTYKKIILPNGTAPLRVWVKDGTAVWKSYLNPTQQIPFFDRIAKLSDDASFAEISKKMLAYTENKFAPQFRWQAQFEDVTNEPVGYTNLSKYTPAALAIYYMQNFSSDAKKTALAKEYMNFCEDQFIMWESYFECSKNTIGKMSDANFAMYKWYVSKGTSPAYPTALEQYGYYIPVNASVAMMMNMYVAAYKCFGDGFYLMKAQALAAGLTRSQRADGHLHTYCGMSTPHGWSFPDEPPNQDEGWINCSIEAALALLDFDNARTAASR